MTRLTQADEVIKRVCLLWRRKFPKGANVMYWNGITDNQFAVLAGAVIAPDGFGACVKPAFPAVSCNAANPKGRAFAGKVFLHKQAVASLAAIERKPTALPRLIVRHNSIHL